MHFFTFLLFYSIPFTLFYFFKRLLSLDIRGEGINEDESREPRPNSFVFSIVRKTLIKAFSLIKDNI